MTRAVGEAGRPAPSEAYANQVAMRWAERSAFSSGAMGWGSDRPVRIRASSQVEMGKGTKGPPRPVAPLSICSLGQSGQMPAITQLSPPANASPCTRDWRLSDREG